MALLKLDEKKIVWGFWQQSYIYVLEDIKKVALISGGLSKDMLTYSVSIRCLNCEVENGCRITTNPSSMGDGLKMYEFLISEHKGHDTSYLKLKALKKYLESVYYLKTDINEDN